MITQSFTASFDRLRSALARRRLSELVLILLLVTLLLRITCDALALPTWTSNLLALLLATLMATNKVAVHGVRAVKAEVSLGWTQFSEWLAVTGWRRLVGVALLALIAVNEIGGTLFDHFNAEDLFVGVLFAVLAIKVARVRPPLQPAIDQAPAPAGGELRAPRANSLFARVGNLGWGRLMLFGLLLLLMAAILDSIIETSPLAGLFGRTEPSTQVSSTQPPVASGTQSLPAASLSTPAAEQSVPQAGQSPVQAKLNRELKLNIGEDGIVVSRQRSDGGRDNIISIGQSGILITEDKDDEASSARAESASEAADAALEQLREVPGMDPEKLQRIERTLRRELHTASTQKHKRHEGFQFATLALLAICSLIAIKVLAGGKHRAEQDADSARVAADMAKLAREAADAKLHAMQAQIEPHFLFNTLASVDQLIQSDPARASQVQKTLIQYLRAAIPQMRDDAQRSLLGRQVAMSRAYLEIMQVRMEERLTFSFSIPEGLCTAEFPSMMLQTLIENAIKHGLEPKPEGGRIEVSAEVARGCLIVRVADSGMGLAPEQHDAPQGVGLANIRERLQLLYGKAARLQLVANPSGGAIASVELPYRDEPASSSTDSH